MTVKPGYKQTEVGVIPEEWEAHQIRSVCRLINGRGFKPHEWETVGLPIIRIQNLNGSEQFNYYSGQFNPKILVEHGQLLFAWSGSRGTSFGPHIWTGGRALLNYHTWKVAVDEGTIHTSFLFHALRHLTAKIEEKAHGASALVHTQKGEMEQFQIPIPPTEAEQRAIATALSDVDALLSGLDRLIAKKRDLKQAALQQLLTGQTRLPGFKGEWEVKRLGEIADILSGGTPSTREPRFWDGDIPWCTPTDITALDGHKHLRETARMITQLGLNASSAEVIPAQSVVMTSRATIGECAINAVPVTTNQGFKNFIPYASTDVDFLYYLLRTQKQGFISLCGGSTFLEIGKTHLVAYEVRLPATKSEQTAIAEVLTSMDDELAALEQRREKTRALKQAMMQELLTGRTRLV